MPSPTSKKSNEESVPSWQSRHAEAKTKLRNEAKIKGAVKVFRIEADRVTFIETVVERGGKARSEVAKTAFRGEDGRFSPGLVEDGWPV